MAKLRIPQPIELAGMRDPLTRAQSQESEIKALGLRYGNVQDAIDELIEAHIDHADALELYESDLRRKIMSMITPSNGGDPLDGGAKTGQSGQSSPGAVAKPVATAKPEVVTVKADEVGHVAEIVDVAPAPASIEAGSPAPAPAAEPVHLTVNGVTQP